MFTLNLPKFCGGCGIEIVSSSFSKGSTTITKKPERSRVRVEKEEYEDFDPDGLDIFQLPNIEKLSYSIDLDKSNKLNLSDLVDVEQFQQFNDQEEKPKPKAKRKKRASRGRGKNN
tara:strand:- start:9301 stop:9648 length:348 start_codon:yes stop_codon:yes gene_type:complete